MTVTGIGTQCMPLAWALSLLVAIGGCSSGGSDGGDGTTPAAAPLTGTFVDSPVQGLGYRTTPSGLSGLTDASGQFNYNSGDTVIFTLFGRPIGTAVPATPVVTPLSVLNQKRFTDFCALNLSQLLLTLGGNPAGTDPIRIPPIPPAGFPTRLNFCAGDFDTLFPGLVSEAVATTHLRANFSTLSVSLALSGIGGRVTSNPAGIACGDGFSTCTIDFPKGTTMTLTPTGAGFTGWSGGCTGTGACVVTLDADTYMTASFSATPGQATLRVAKDGNGTGVVTSAPAGIDCGAICRALLIQGAVELTAQADPDSTFAGWRFNSGNANCVGVGVCSILLTVDSGVTARFTLNTVSASVRPSTFSGNGGGGTVQCSANGGAAGPCGSYPIGSAMVLTATPNAVSNFTGWLGAGCSGTGTCTFTLTDYTVVTANFNRPTLTVQLAGSGLVSSDPPGINSCLAICSAPFDKGIVTLTASGVGFAGWSGGGCAGAGTCLVTLSQDSTITATFTAVGLPPFAQQAYLKASTIGTQNQFGWSVALSGDTLVVGAPLEDSNATGVSGDQANNSAPESGAVYVFTQTGGVWSQEAYLKASDPEAADRFGTSVALSGDTLVVGAPLERSCATGVNGNQTDIGCLGSGAAYVLTRTGGVWSQQAYLKASNTGVDDAFGHSVALSGDTLVVGAHFEDSDIFDNIVKSGTAYIFTRVGGVWSQEALLKASNTRAGDQFGWSVALSGDTLVAGANGESSCATGVNGNQADTGCRVSGAVYVFTRIGGIWNQEAYLKASNSRQGYGFGGSVALSGDTLVAGATHDGSCATGVNGNQTDNSCNSSGAAYVFTRTGGVWSQQAYVKASNTGTGDSFGWSVALSGNTLVVGAPYEASNSTGVNGNQFFNDAFRSGAAYVFTKAGGVWSQQAYLKASNTGTEDLFGGSIALFGNTLVVGVSRESSNAIGVNGDQTNNSAVNSGAAYVFVAQ